MINPSRRSCIMEPLQYLQIPEPIVKETDNHGYQMSDNCIGGMAVRKGIADISSIIDWKVVAHEWSWFCWLSDSCCLASVQGCTSFLWFSRLGLVIAVSCKYYFPFTMVTPKTQCVDTWVEISAKFWTKDLGRFGCTDRAQVTAAVSSVWSQRVWPYPSDRNETLLAMTWFLKNQLNQSCTSLIKEHVRRWFKHTVTWYQLYEFIRGTCPPWRSITVATKPPVSDIMSIVNISQMCYDRHQPVGRARTGTGGVGCWESNGRKAAWKILVTKWCRAPLVQNYLPRNYARI